MLNVHVRLIAPTGAIRHEKRLVSENHKSLWRELSQIALTDGEDGDMLRVADEHGDIIVHMGVSTARDMASAESFAV
jgi:hypothetical protein